jgi:uncharacterized protein (TIGR04255 family)
MALTFKRYKSAPIVEAVIELRVAPDGVDRSALESLVELLKTDFPKRTRMQRVQMGIAAQEGHAVGHSLSQAVIGSRLAKADDSRILQIRQDGLAYSHMAPYTEWDTFRTEALPLWRQYRTARRDAKPTRCALRYINRVDIPGSKIEPQDYFGLYPNVPKSLPQQDVIGMDLTLQMPQADLDCVANITQAMVTEPVKPGHISFILDIDVFRLGIESWSDDDVWGFLEKLRARKNEIFEACITDRTRELIDR